MSNLAEIAHVPKKEHEQFVSKEFFTDGASADFEFIQFIHNDKGNRLWRDSAGKLYSEPFIFNYIGASLDNGTYHLDELIEHLMKRDDIAFITESEGYSRYKSTLLRGPLTGKEEGVNKIISDIPGYNRDEGRDETICVVYYPKQEDLMKILQWDEKKEKSKEIWSLEQFIVRKILGAEAYLKKPVVEQEPEIPKRKFKR